MPEPVDMLPLRHDRFTVHLITYFSSLLGLWLFGKTNVLANFSNIVLASC